MTPDSLREKARAVCRVIGYDANDDEIGIFAAAMKEVAKSESDDLTAALSRAREALEDLLRSYESRRRVHIGQGPVSGQIGADEYDRYWHTLRALPTPPAAEGEKL